MASTLAIDWRAVQRRLGVAADGIAGPVTWAAVFRHMGAPAARATEMAAGARATMTDAGLTLSRLRLAHFLGQVAHESGGFVHMREIWGPTPAQRRYERDFSAPWPRTAAEANQPQFHPNRLAFNLGNTEPGDGRRYMGRGPIQITGRFNYELFGRILGLPLLDQPALAEEPAIGLRIACAFWNRRGLSAHADRDDGRTVTLRINGGTNGLHDRMVRTERAKALLA